MNAKRELEKNDFKSEIWDFKEHTQTVNTARVYYYRIESKS